MDCLTGFASSIAIELVKGAKHQLQYSCCFNGFVEDLQKEKDSLITTRKSVQDRVEHDKKQAIEMDEVVRQWLEGANTDMDDVDGLLEKASKYKSCCFGHCPNWICRCLLGKKLEEKTKDVQARNTDGKPYIQIERVAPLPSLADSPSEDFLNFDSRESAYKQLMEAVKDDRVSMIGLWGMPGCGKTKLAMEVGKRAEAEHLFEKVLFVAVSSKVEVHRIQDKIASALTYEFPEKEEKERAQRLCKRLTDEKSILVILDDVWQMLDFDLIGIPSSENHKGCKVLITTQKEGVCIGMDCQRKIHLSFLTNEEAWALFQKQAHISEGTSNTLKDLARQISDECKGLPVAIAAVASTLKGKAEVEWKLALDTLRDSEPVDIEKGLQNPYNCLQLSYDNLDNAKAESLFFLCSVFPEDSEIPVEYLARFAIGLGIVGEVRSYERARNEVIAAKNKLLSSCLLLEADADDVEGECVKMHDLVRNVALWIAKKENKVIRCALEKDVTMETNSIRYLFCEEFPNELDCSNLEFLWLNTYVDVSDEIFKRMGNLRVLCLCGFGGMRPLSMKSFKPLTNLRCLFLLECDVCDTSFVGDIKNLESLTLKDCSFSELPDVAATLPTNLRLLEGTVPLEVSGRDQRLEELHMEWDVRRETSRSIVKEIFSKCSVPEALQRYRIQIGSGFKDCRKLFLDHRKTLFLSFFDTSNAAFKDLAKKAEVLYIEDIQGGANNIIPDIFQIEGGGMNELIELQISDSEEMKCLVDTSNYNNVSEAGTIFSELRKLTIKRTFYLEALCHGQPPRGLFEKLEELYLSQCGLAGILFVRNLNLCSLKVLSVSKCDELTSLFTPAVAASLIQLEELTIFRCDGLKHILADGEISGDDHRSAFQKLKRLSVGCCGKLEYIIPVPFAKGLQQLECLVMEDNDELKYVFGQCKLADQISQNELKIELPALQELTLLNMPNIISVFPKNCYPTWPSLRQFDLQNCPEFAWKTGSKVGKQCHHSNTKLEGLSIDEEKDSLTICLQELRLVHLPQLRYIFSANFAGGLKELTIENCNQLDHIIEDEECQHFPNLHSEPNQLEDVPESTSISLTPPLNYKSGSFIACLFTTFSKRKLGFCRKKYLWHSAKARRTSHKHPLPLEKVQNKQVINLSSLKRLSLKSCSNLGSLFTASTAKTLTSLEELMIEDCHGLKHILTHERSPKNEKEEIAQDNHDFERMFPSLKKLSVMRCDLLQYIFPVSFARNLVKLKNIEINETPELKYVFGQSNFEDSSCHQQRKMIEIELPILEELKLQHIQNLISICPDNYYVACSSLRKLSLYLLGFSTTNCSPVASEARHRDYSSIKELGALVMQSNQIINKAAVLQAVQNVEEIVARSFEIEGIFQLPAELATNRKPDLLTSYLKRLHLENLPGLMYICTGSIQSMSFQYLEQVKVYGCNKLKYIFSSCIARGLPRLEELIIEYCEQLEQIFEDEKPLDISYLSMESCQIEEFQKSTSNSSVIPQMAGPSSQCNLKRLILRSCSRLRLLFSPSTAISLTLLEELRIEECHGLRYLVTHESAHKHKEKIIQENQDSLSYVSLFKRLKEIIVLHCNSLEYIFHVSFAQGLGELKHIVISGTPQLRYVFGANIHDVHSSHQYQNKIQIIKLPVLEKVELYSMPNMIGICPDNYSTTCSSLQQLAMVDVGLSTLSINNLMVDYRAAYLDHSSTTDIGAARMNGQMLGYIAIWNSSKIESIFHLQGFPIKGRQVTLWLTVLDFFNLPKLRYIWRGAERLVSLQNLYKIHIWGCPKLKAIFSASVLRSLPLLNILAVIQCEKLEQIIEENEENENVSNPQSPKICFSHLKLLLVTHCDNLKRLFYLSTSYEFPELKYLIINQDSRLEEVFVGEQGLRKGRAEVFLPELKHVVLMKLPNLKNICQGIEFQTPSKLLVYSCPNLSLTSTTTAMDMLRNNYYDAEIDFLVRRELSYIRDIITTETPNEGPMPEITSQLHMSPEVQAASESELPSSQVNGSNQSMLRNLAGSVHEPNHAESGATESESYEFLTSERKNKGTQDVQSLEQKLPAIPSPKSTENIEETETTIIGEVRASVKSALQPSGSELRGPSSTSLATPLHKIPSHSTEDTPVKESGQEGSTSEEAVKATLSTGLEGISLGGVVATHNESSGTDILAQDSQAVEQDDKLNESETGTSPCQKIQNVDDSTQKASNLMDKEGEIDTCRSHSLIVVELVAFKHFVDLDDAQIALLAEAIAVYPHLWKVCETQKFSERFQAWMLKTLADMLLFLRSESAVSVTPELENKFHKLCDEAVQLGFERSWVDEMRQRVVVRDPGVDHAQARLTELLKRHDQLTRELRKIKGEINSLNDFVDSQKTCFDFL